METVYEQDLSGPVSLTPLLFFVIYFFLEFIFFSNIQHSELNLGFNFIISLFLYFSFFFSFSYLPFSSFLQDGKLYV